MICLKWGFITTTHNMQWEDPAYLSALSAVTNSLNSPNYCFNFHSLYGHLTVHLNVYSM